MKQPHPGFVQPVLRCQPQGFADIAQQHVRPLDFHDWLLEGFGNSFFYQAFPQADPQVAANDLHNVFGFQRRGPAQQGFQNCLFVCSCAPARQLFKDTRQFQN